jgi:hypothetical protein
MQGFLISAAKQINRVLVDAQGKRRRGRVFGDRYFAEGRKHHADRGERSSTWLVDPFSTGALFSGWTQLAGQHVMWPLREGWLSMFVWLPRTWLLAEGWRRHGLVDAREVPSHRRITTVR